MTVIAVRDGVMASDSKLTGAFDSYLTDCIKIRKVQGWLIGAAGDFNPTELFMSKFDPKTIEEKRFIPWGTSGKDEELTALIVSPKGKIYYMETNGTFIHVKGSYIAIGTGEVAAMAAMTMGASAAEACRVAIRHSEGCGGRIKTIKLRTRKPTR